MNSPRISAEAIDAVLPQTQCGKCGYAGCMPYAEALADGKAAINRCPPGGPKGIAALADLLQLPVIALDPACGVELPRTLALIEEEHCIGCTLCIQACPVDAIVGAAKQMHTVLADRCTGCELCVPPCPVDCIVLLPHPLSEITREFSDLSRVRYRQRNTRLARVAAEKQQQRATTEDAPEARKRRILAAAMAAAKQRQSSR
jgi:Na+-translocating ferredoxin:NAD+ oxidoreductase subunit B